MKRLIRNKKNERELIMWLIEIGIEDYNVTPNEIMIWGKVSSENLIKLAKKGFCYYGDRLKFLWKKKK